MSVMDKLERKFGRNAGPNLMLILIICYAVGFVASSMFPQFAFLICFDPALIAKGQVWRIFTFVMMPESSNIFIALIFCFIYFSISRSLEMVIGRLRLNVFLITGLLLQIIAALAYYWIASSSVVLLPYADSVTILNPYYVYATLFVLFSILFPDAQFLFMFFFPIKGKWMIFITLFMYGMDVVRAFVTGMSGYAWMLVAMILGAVLNLLLFLALNRYSARRRPDNIVNMRSRRNAASGAAGNARTYRHKCCVCGRTDITNPELDFRYCSKCIGNYEYCQEHLYTHVHKGPGGNVQQ